MPTPFEATQQPERVVVSRPRAPEPPSPEVLFEVPGFKVQTVPNTDNVQFILSHANREFVAEMSFDDWTSIQGALDDYETRCTAPS